MSTAGGKRYTPIDELASQQAGRAIFIDNKAFSKQFKNYFRTDFKITYRFNGFGKTQEFFFNIDNVFNNKNVYTQIYSSRSNKLEYVYQLGLFPTFQYKIFFWKICVLSQDTRRQYYEYTKRWILNIF